MTKELEAFDCIKFSCCNFEDRTLFQDEFNIIETALKRLEEIDKLPKTEFYTSNKIELDNELDKKLKAFEIVKEKRVEVMWLINRPLEDYNKNHFFELTQEEYNLLKGVLTDVKEKD